MNPDEQKRAYQAFFLNNEAGRELYKHLHELIEREHRDAENDPDHARDFVQRAAGVRGIISHIQSVTAEGKPKV